MQTDTLSERGLRYWFGALARLVASVFFGGLGGTVLGVALSLSYLSRRSAPNGMPIIESEHMVFTGALALLGGMTVGLLLTPQKMPQLRWLLLCAIANPIGMFLLIGPFTAEPGPPFPGRAEIPAFERVVLAGDSVYLISASATSYRIDVRDPHSPRVQGPAFGANRPGDLSSAARDIQIVDGRGYIAAEGQGLAVLDLRDPARPALLGESRAAGLALDGARVGVDGELAALAWTGHLALLDVRDPARMALVAQTSSERWQEPLEVKLVGNWVYLLHRKGLAIIERSPSGTLEQRATLPFEESFRLQIVGQRAYVLANNRLHRLDISDPARPTPLDPITEEGGIAAAWVEGTQVYLLTRSQNRLKVVDLARPDLPAVQAQYSLPEQSGGFGGSSPNFTVRDGIVYLITPARSLATLGLRNGQPERWTACVIYARSWPKCAQEPLPQQASAPQRSRLDFDRVAVDAGMAFLFSGGHGAYRIDLRDQPGARVQLRDLGLDRTNSMLDLRIAGGRAYVMTREQGLTVLDLSSPRTPTVLGQAPASLMEVKGEYLSVEGGLAALAGTGGVALLDARDPANITLAERYNSNDSRFYRGVELVGGRIYALTWDGLEIIERGPAGVLQSRSTLAIPSSERLVVAGTRAYVLADMKLHIIDISDPSRPAVLSVFNSKFEIKDIDMEGTRAYMVMHGGSVFQVVDLDDPSRPEVLTDIFLNDVVETIAVRDGLAYMGAEEHSLTVFDLGQPDRPEQLATCDVYSDRSHLCSPAP